MSEKNNSVENENSVTAKIEKLGIKLSSILDLEELDAHIYLNLLRMGPVTASSLAKEIHIDRTKAYRTIDKLLQLKIVSTTLSKPKLCVANKPEDVLSEILHKKENQINRIRQVKKEIIETINNTIPTKYSSNLPTFHIAQGTMNIYSEIEKLLEKSTGIVYIVTTLKDVSKMYHTAIPEKIKICEKNGGAVRLVTEIDDYDSLPFVLRFGATQNRCGKLRSKGRIVVEKGNSMIMSDAVSDGSQRSMEADFAICTNSPEMVNNISTLCSLLWEESDDIKLPHIQFN